MKHHNFKVTKCGFLVNSELLFLHATCDFSRSCDCCGQGCSEVKCLYCVEGLNFKSYVQRGFLALRKITMEFMF